MERTWESKRFWCYYCFDSAVAVDWLMYIVVLLCRVITGHFVHMSQHQCLSVCLFVSDFFHPPTP